eukprot:368600-Rhodomonas_salina.2
MAHQAAVLTERMTACSLPASTCPALDLSVAGTPSYPPTPPLPNVRYSPTLSCTCPGLITPIILMSGTNVGYRATRSLRNVPYWLWLACGYRATHLLCRVRYCALYSRY